MAKKCPRCKTRIALRHHSYCEPCSDLCARCKKQPKRKSSAYCRECSAQYRRDYIAQTMTPALALQNYLRGKVNRQIRQGKVERLPCAICDRSPTYCHFPNLTIETMVFLCREHLNIANDTYGVRAKAERAAKDGVDSQS